MQDARGYVGHNPPAPKDRPEPPPLPPPSPMLNETIAAGRKVNDVPRTGMTWPEIKEWARMRAAQHWQERVELHGPRPFPWFRLWRYTWRIGGMLAWAGFWWAFAEWTK